jgi:hypothetical protein
MARQTIDLGTSANKGDGDPLRVAFDKVNDNFSELYARDLGSDSGSSVGGNLIPEADGSFDLGSETYRFGDVYIKDFLYINNTRLEVDSNGNLRVGGQMISNDVQGSVFADDSTLMVDGVNGTLNATTLVGALPAIDGSALTGITTAFSNITSKPTTIAGYGITDALALGTSATTALAGDTTFSFADITSKPTTIAGYGISDAFDGVFASLTSKPTTIAGFGITDAYTKTEVDSSIANVTAGQFDFNITGDDSTVRTVAKGDTLQITGGTAITTASDADGNITITGVAQDFAFSSITGTPTTIAGYGITDALTAGGALTGSSLEAVAVGAGVADGNDLTITGGDATELNSTGGDTNITGGSGALASGNVNIGATQTVLVSIGSNGTNVDFPSGTQVDFTGATITGLSVSGLQSRSTATGTTGSLADAAEADLDITGFKSYALLTITTDRAARVRLYATAATRTADASRAEGVDPTADAGLIAEVITTGAETVIISPGAYGFNLESSPTTTIPCRVTNKSGGASTVQVDLNVVQLEA